MSLELPPWVKGRVDAEVQKLLGSGDAVQASQKEWVIQKVYRKLQEEAGEVTPTRILLLVREALRETEGWAKDTRKRHSRLDIQDKLEDD